MNQSKLFTLVAATSLSLSIGCSSKKPEAPTKAPAAEASRRRRQPPLKPKPWPCFNRHSKPRAGRG